jgi:hypothetical protein
MFEFKMPRRLSRVLAVLTLCLCASACGAAGTDDGGGADMPADGGSATGSLGVRGQYLGIPDPPLGLKETHGAVTAFADGPEALRNVGPGAVVEVRGSHGEEEIRCAGTQAAPAFIVGGEGHRITGTWLVRGSWCILDGLVFAGEEATIGLTGDHIALRNSDISGPYSRQGASAGIATGDATDIVIYKNKVHDRGDTRASFDQDAHAISPGQGSRRIWILENEAYRNSGDGVQVNPYPYNSGRGTISSVYIGKNKIGPSNQSGIGIKMGKDIIVSENEVFGNSSASFNPGPCIGYQYGSENVWFVANNVHDCTIGIFAGGDLGGEARERKSYAVRNQISNMTGPRNACGNGPVWECSSIYITGGEDWFLVDNAISGSALEPLHAIRISRLELSGNKSNDQAVDAAKTEGDIATTNVSAETVYAAFQSLYGLDIRR